MKEARLDQLLSMLADQPNDSFLRFAIAKEFEKLGQEDSAFQYYQKILETDPDYIGLYYHLGKWYEKQGRYEEALAIYQGGMEVAKHKNDQHALGELAAARLNLADED